MPVGEMVQRMSSSELSEWAAYLNIKHAEQEKAHREAEAKAKSRR